MQWLIYLPLFSISSIHLTRNFGQLEPSTSTSFDKSQPNILSAQEKAMALNKNPELSLLRTQYCTIIGQTSKTQ